MSLEFSEEISAPIISPTYAPQDAGEIGLRPKLLSDYTGQEKAKGNPDIIFTGFISGNVLGEIYSNAYVVTLPSDIEGMSLSLLEALAYGNAVLCSDIPENTLVTEDKAMHFKKSDVEDLRKQLENAISSNSCEKWRKPEEISNYILEKYEEKSYVIFLFSLSFFLKNSESAKRL